MTPRPRLAITLGDPCGIGPELLLRSLGTLCAWADVIVVGAQAGPWLLDPDPEAGGRRVDWAWKAEPDLPADLDIGHARALRIQTLHRGAESEATREGRAMWLDPIPGVRSNDLVLGAPSAASGRCALAAVRLAARLVMAGHADALVTLPLSKAACHLAGEIIPGHTELLQALSGSTITRMAFLSPSLSVVLHTVHQSLRSVIEALDAASVARTLSFTADRFMHLTARRELRIALCALNPHAGEKGAFGNEEALLEEARRLAEADFSPDTPSGPFASLPSPFPPGSPPEGWALWPGGRIEPSVPEPAGTGAASDGPRFFGPLPADSLFHRAVQGEFDVVVALYHDQGLIPLKTLEPLRAVNVTLGLPFIRTSPDHGTAFDKAGRWSADPTNFLEACALAVRLAARARSQPWRAEVDRRED